MIRRFFIPKVEYHRAAMQRGVALLTALLITALVAMVATELVTRQHFDIRRTANILQTDQAYLYSLGIESVISKVVLNYRKQKNNYDDIKDLETLNASPPFPVEGGAVAFHVDDMESMFNINNIVKDSGEKDQEQFDLMQFIFSKYGMQGVADAVLDWVDKDTQTSGLFGAEDGDYLGMQPAYRPPNRRMASVTELMLVKGFKDKDPDLMKQRMEIFKVVTALPDKTPININTAKVEVLRAVFEKYAFPLATKVESILTDRVENPIQDAKNDLSKLTIFTGVNATDVTNYTGALAKIFDQRTSYLLVTANAVVGQSTNQLSSLIYMATASNLGNKLSETIVVARSQGTPGMF